MIVTKLMGGLGNQMFQYALGRRLARDRGVPLKLDLSWYEQARAAGIDTSREYALDGWRIAAEIATGQDLARFSLAARVLGRFGARGSAAVRERGFMFDPRVLEVPATVHISGYWQSERYFRPIRELLLEEFTLAAEPCAHAMGLEPRLGASEAVAVHVRRGDYVANATTHAYHGTCSLEYYQEAAQRVAVGLTDPTFFVFSDDPDWAQRNLRLRWPTVYVVHGDACAPHQDIRLMSLCAHHITANSSFSWWGAWLCRNESKRVVAPRKWFSGFAQSTDDLIPDTWLRI